MPHEASGGQDRDSQVLTVTKDRAAIVSLVVDDSRQIGIGDAEADEENGLVSQGVRDLLMVAVIEGERIHGTWALRRDAKSCAGGRLPRQTHGRVISGDERPQSCVVLAASHGTCRTTHVRFD